MTQTVERETLDVELGVSNLWLGTMWWGWINCADHTAPLAVTFNRHNEGPK